MNVKFQYLPPNVEFPDEITFSDAAIKNVEVIPSVGDYVLLIQTYPENQRGNPKKCKVVSRHFAFIGQEKFDTVTLVVVDYEDSPESRCRE